MRIPSIFLKPGYLSLAAVLGVHLLVTDALAERDSFHLGSGRDGALTVSTTGAVVNAYAQVTAALAAGDSVIAVASATGFAAGDLVMLHQSTGVTPVPAAGAQTQIDLTSAGVGRYELARVLSVIGTSITLTAPVINGFAANVTQVIRVPEYTTVTVNPGRSVAPAAWNGVTGGVVAFLANGTLTNNGSVDARGRGFRGGQPVDDTSGTTGATGLDESAPTGAQKGEGIAVTRYGASNTGRGNVANGAGGGVALKSGGGGGGHGGQGGQGGNSDLNLDGNRVIGGLGGASLTYNLLDHMVFGGGGGAGHSTEVNAGTGGGCIFIRASSLAGAGSFFANGSSSGSATDAASGGGAGGTVILRVAGAATVGAIQATGGTGGSTGSIAIGPGGGGAGGRIYFQKGSGTAALSGTSVIGANSGTQLDPGAPGGSAYGATSGTGGAATTASSGFTSPSTPVILAPANGATGISTTPAYTGTATAGSIVHLLVDNVEIATPTADGSGNFTFTPVASLSSATHTVKAYAEDSTQATFSVLSNTNTFTTGQLAPTVTTATQSTVTATSATLGGEVTAEGGASVTDRGIVWGLAANPTITADTKVANGSGMGTFSATVGSLPSNTLIHVRAYATNSVSTSYGADISFNTLPAVAVPAPTVTASTANLLATATSLTITGTNFDSVTPGNNTVVFTPAGSGTVTAATPTSLTVTSVTGLRGGNLNAVVTNGGGSSGAAVQVATVSPVVTSSTRTIDTATTSLVINGFGFNPTASGNSVVFSPAGTGTVTGATATSLTVTSITGLTAGALNAVVTTNTVSSGAAVQVATVIPATTNFMIQPSAVLAAPYDGGPGFAPSDAISKTGLSAPYSSGITSFETYMAGSPTHTGSNVPSNYYGNGGSTLSGPQNIDFDLGATYSLNKIAFWNFPFNTNGPITSLQVYTSTDSAFTAPVLVGTFNPVNNGGLSATAPVAGQTFLLTNSNARYVRLRALAYLDGHVGFSEIAFGGISGAPEIAVSGNSVDIADGDAIPSTADNTDFGSTPVQGGVVENTYTITNSGTTNLTLSGGPNFVSVDNAAFSVTLQPSGTIAPAGTTTFKIAFNPTAQGSAPAVVSFTNNDGNESPFDFAIIGIGTGPQTFDLAGNPVSNTPFDGGDTYIYSAGPPPPQPINSAVGDVVSGGGAPDATGADSGADFDVLKRGGFLSENGTLAFPGNLLVGFGTPPVTLSDFRGIWKDNGTGLKLIARTGTIAPGTTTDTFNGLPDIPGISDNGDVTILGSLTVSGGTTASNDTGLWTQVGSGTTPSTFKLLAREGSVVPGTTAVVRKFASGAYATASLSATQGVVAYSVTTVGSPDKTAIYSTTMDNGVPTSSAALAIEGDAAPGVSGQTFGPLASSYSDPARMDAAGNVAFAAILKPSNKESLWYAPFSTGVAAKIFFAGDVAPDTGGATFLNLKSQAMGGTGTVTFRGLLNTNTGDNTGNLKNDGIWRGTGSNAASYTCILRRGDSNASRPGLNLPNAADKVGNLWHSWFTNANHGAWVGQLDAGGDGTSIPAPGDAYAIYTDLSGTMTLYMLIGDPAPGIAGATMASVDLPIVGGQEQLVFIGKVSGGGVSAGIDDQGIWRSAPNGGALSLLIRTGDSMTTTAGVKTIAKVDFPGSNSKARQWEQPVMDSTGRVLIFVTFTDGSTSQVIAP